MSSNLQRCLNYEISLIILDDQSEPELELESELELLELKLDSKSESELESEWAMAGILEYPTNREKPFCPGLKTRCSIFLMISFFKVLSLR
jgi:hypothetical protein